MKPKATSSSDCPRANLEEFLFPIGSLGDLVRRQFQDDLRADRFPKLVWKPGMSDLNLAQRFLDWTSISAVYSPSGANLMCKSGSTCFCERQQSITAFASTRDWKKPRGDLRPLYLLKALKTLSNDVSVETSSSWSVLTSDKFHREIWINWRRRSPPNASRSRPAIRAMSSASGREIPSLPLSSTTKKAARCFIEIRDRHPLSPPTRGFGQAGHRIHRSGQAGKDLEPPCFTQVPQHTPLRQDLGCKGGCYGGDELEVFSAAR